MILFLALLKQPLLKERRKKTGDSKFLIGIININKCFLMLHFWSFVQYWTMKRWYCQSEIFVKLLTITLNNSLLLYHCISCLTMNKAPRIRVIKYCMGIKPNLFMIRGFCIKKVHVLYAQYCSNKKWKQLTNYEAQELNNTFKYTAN